MFALLLVLVARASAAASRGATAFPRTCLVISGYDVEATIGEAIESVGAQSESDNVFLHADGRCVLADLNAAERMECVTACSILSRACIPPRKRHPVVWFGQVWLIEVPSEGSGQ